VQGPRDKVHGEAQLCYVMNMSRLETVLFYSAADSERTRL